MEQKYLVVNTGSASKKYGLFADGRLLCECRFEIAGRGKYEAIWGNEQHVREELDKRSYEEALNLFLDRVTENGAIKTVDEVAAVGLRVVAPACQYQKHQILNDKLTADLEGLSEMARVHLKPALMELAGIRRRLKEVVVVAVSDSAFHRSIPKVARTYAIDRGDALKFDLQRVGYHGISIASVVRKIPKIWGRLPAKMIVLHLGSGASVTAVYHGKSLETSMGKTPVEGLVMGTRVGDVDAGLVAWLARRKNLSWESMEDYLNKKSGLLGISGKTSDVRELYVLEKQGDEQARLALDVFVYRVKKYVGAYCGIMEGVDALVFTATIGTRADWIRERVCRGLEWLGLELDRQSNESVSGDALIGSGEKMIAVVENDELGEMARIVGEVLLRSRVGSS